MFRIISHGRFKCCVESTRTCCKTVHLSHGNNEYMKDYTYDKLSRWISAYRRHGHKMSRLNPLLSYTNMQKDFHFDPFAYKLDRSDKCEYSLHDLLPAARGKFTLQEVEKLLTLIYCSNIGIEADHLHEEEKKWFYNSFENIQLHMKFLPEERRRICEELLKAQMLEKYCSVKFSTVKRYGIEGADTTITLLGTLLQRCASAGLSDVVITAAHRGRLGILFTLLKLPPTIIFRKMQGLAEYPENYRCTGDVLSHLRNTVELKFGDKILNVSMIPNPSHLEAAAPVVVGKVRSMLAKNRLGEYSSAECSTSDTKVLAVQLHGDAAFSGQGVIMETLAMSQVPGFRIGGCLHVVINNQIGYTTPPELGRSSPYCSDVIKMIESPIIHVNGAYPEEVAKATILALEYRQKFRKDIVIDLFCFRRHGHNEMDDPSFTNPLMYMNIKKQKSFPDLYFEELQKESIITSEERHNLVKEVTLLFDESMKQSKSKNFQFSQFSKQWEHVKQAKKSIVEWNSGLPLGVLKFIGGKSVAVPDAVNLHATLKKNFVYDRLKKIQQGSNIDWATGEALAIGSLLCQGYNVRLSGQDVGRGTFSQRHFLITDQQSGRVYVPLNHIIPSQTAFLEVANSILSEEAVVGFEYGYSTDNPTSLVMWEAQFGDFFNSAQVMFDTFISSGETKWLMQSGIVILLPHGYDGGGPEHSSCRIERFLQMSDSSESELDGDDVNWSVVYPTTPAQIFHLLRKQMICEYKKPLIVVSPKVILRHPSAVSSLHDMSSGTMFKPVLHSSVQDPDNVMNIVFCSGKHYYALQKEKELRNITDTVLIRIEQICPFPALAIHEAIKDYKNAQSFRWSQEEHQNMGVWGFANVRFQNIFGIKLEYIGRKELASPAVGVNELHEQETDIVVKATFRK